MWFRRVSAAVLAVFFFLALNSAEASAATGGGCTGWTTGWVSGVRIRSCIGAPARGSAVGDTYIGYYKGHAACTFDIRVVDRYQNVKSWSGWKNCIPAGARGEQFARAPQVNGLTGDYYTIVHLCRAGGSCSSLYSPVIHMP